MNNDCVTTIIKKYFERENILENHQIDSYDNFIDFIVPSILSDKFPIVSVFNDKDRNITISVRINHFDLPAAGFAMTSDCGAVYEIMDRSTGNIIFSTDVRTSGTTPTDYAFAGVIRAQESINRCARNNIGIFLDRLDDAQI